MQNVADVLGARITEKISFGMLAAGRARSTPKPGRDTDGECPTNGVAMSKREPHAFNRSKKN